MEKKKKLAFLAITAAVFSVRRMARQMFSYSLKRSVKLWGKTETFSGKVGAQNSSTAHVEKSGAKSAQKATSLQLEECLPKHKQQKKRGKQRRWNACLCCKRKDAEPSPPTPSLSDCLGRAKSLGRALRLRLCHELLKNHPLKLKPAQLNPTEHDPAAALGEHK